MGKPIPFEASAHASIAQLASQKEENIQELRGLFKKFLDCLNCTALICSRCIRLVSLGSQRSADYDAIFWLQISLF